MTLKDVKREVLNLGFETSESYEEEPSILSDAISRALREITNTFPIIGEYQIVQNPLPNLLGERFCTMHYDGKNPMVFRAQNAKAIYFEYSGEVMLTVQDDNGKTTEQLMQGDGFLTCRRFVSGDVTLLFTGRYSFDIKNLAVYAERISADVGEIPAFRERIRYDMRELTKENGAIVFIDFLNQIVEGDPPDSYLSLSDFQVEKRHVLVLDGRKKAQYTVFYKRDIPQITVDTPDTFLISLDADQEHLLPLLAAWYVWADDEPAKAAKWRNDYEDFKIQLLSSRRDYTPFERLENVQGW